MAASLVLPKKRSKVMVCFMIFLDSINMKYSSHFHSISLLLLVECGSLYEGDSVISSVVKEGAFFNENNPDDMRLIIVLV